MSSPNRLPGQRGRGRRRPGVYLLHFDQKLYHAGHYLGSAADVGVRLDQHENGKGARLTQVIKELGITYRVAVVWYTDTVREARLLEVRLKAQKNGRKLCPRCK